MAHARSSLPPFARAFCAALLTILTLASLPQTAAATGLVIRPSSGVGAPTLVPLEQLDVGVEASDIDAVVRERRVYAAYAMFSDFGFGDDGARSSVTFYRSFPLVDAPAVTGFVVRGSALEGRILAPEEADELRLELVSELGDPAPLRELGSPMFVSEPFEGSTLDLRMGIEIEVESSVRAIARGTLRGISAPVDWHKRPATNVTVDTSIETESPLRAVYAPYHSLAVSRDGAYAAAGRYYGNHRCTSFDVTVLWSTGTEPIRLDALPYRYGAGPRQEDGSLLLLVTPDLEAEGAAAVARDIVVVLDRSGSMTGAKMTQATDALLGVLADLDAADRFALVAFDSDVEPFESRAVQATPANLERARAFVRRQEAGGATNLHDALGAAFDSLSEYEERPRYVVVLTDGQPTEGVTDTESILHAVRKRNSMGARVFAFGIGSDVNTVLLDRLGRESAGDTLYIRHHDQVAETVRAFFEQVQSPVLADPVLDLSAFGGTMLYPGALQDLYAGRSTVVLARYTTPGAGAIRLTGVRDGEPTSIIWAAHLPEHAIREGYVPRIWATRHVGEILRGLKLGEDDPAAPGRALEVAERFGVVTEYTYFEVDEHGDTVMVYSAVPVDAVGSVAVDTSSTIDRYQKGGTVDAPADTWIRYVWDRTFPTRDGWFTDTSTDGLDASWTELRFGSERYMRLALEQAHLGLAAFFAVAPNVRFEHHGRLFRVTDAANEEIAAPPAPSDTVPAPRDIPLEGDVTVRWEGTPAGADATPASGEIASGHGGPAPTAETLSPPRSDPFGGGDEAPTLTDSRDGAPDGRDAAIGCSSSSRGPGAGGASALLAVLVLSLLRRRRAFPASP